MTPEIRTTTYPEDPDPPAAEDCCRRLRLLSGVRAAVCLSLGWGWTLLGLAVTSDGPNRTAPPEGFEGGLLGICENLGPAFFWVAGTLKPANFSRHSLASVSLSQLGPVDSHRLTAAGVERLGHFEFRARVKILTNMYRP